MLPEVGRSRLPSKELPAVARHRAVISKERGL
jgi:hypothetical protein